MAGKCLLFFAEAVTLAHLARPLALIEQLTGKEYDIHLACPKNPFRRFLRDFPCPVHELDSMSPASFRRALDWGLPIFTEKLLRQYIKTDLALMDRLRPDAVIGDFRLSLAISARVAKVRYINLANAYWRPEFCPVPPLPRLKPFAWVPRQWLEPVFKQLIPHVFAAHAKPFNRLANEYGLQDFGGDVRNIYTNGDTVLYCDIPEMFPGLPLPDNHYFLGPILWAPPVPDPPWWETLPDDKPVVYVVAGSSGSGKVFKKVLDYLARQPVTVIAALGGEDSGVRGNLYCSPWLDGLKSARRADLMICNGGVMGCHQAWMAGIPVLGVCSNMDQFLNMKAVESAGLGKGYCQESFLENQILSPLEFKQPERQSPDLDDLADRVSGLLQSIMEPRCEM